MGDKFGFDRMVKQWKTEKEKILKELETESLKFFKANYDKEGFENSNFQKWKPKKRPNGQPTLVATGLLRKSFKSNISGNKISISNPVWYGVFHHTGTAKMVQRKFLGNSRALELANAKRIVAHVHRIFKK